MADGSTHSGGSSYTNGFHDGQQLKAGKIIRVPNQGDPRKGVTRVIDVKGDVEGEQLRSNIETFGFGPGSEIGHVNSVSTSDGRTSHAVSPYSGPNGYSGVSRKTEEGSNYVHRFKDPAKIKRAGELIASLASKRASKIVESK